MNIKSKKELEEERVLYKKEETMRLLHHRIKSYVGKESNGWTVSGYGINTPIREMYGKVERGHFQFTWIENLMVISLVTDGMTPSVITRYIASLIELRKEQGVAVTFSHKKFVYYSIKEAVSKLCEELTRIIE